MCHIFIRSKKKKRKNPDILTPIEFLAINPVKCSNRTGYVETIRIKKGFLKKIYANHKTVCVRHGSVAIKGRNVEML